MTQRGFMPGAIVENIPPGSNDPAIIPVGVIQHVAVSNSDDIRPIFTNGSGIESHFYVQTDGTIRQYRSIYFEADAQFAGNSFGSPRKGFVSVEHEGGVGADLNLGMPQVQLDAFHSIILWVHEQTGFPLRVCPAWDAPGVGYHALFDQWNTSHHSCPGPGRIAQFHNVTVPWLRAQRKPLPEPTKAAPVKLGHPNKALGQTEAFGDSDRGIRYFAKKGCKRVDGNALPDSAGQLANTHWQSFLRHGFTPRDGSKINRDLTVNHFTTADLHSRFWTRRGHYVIDSIDNRIRLAWSLGMDYELELKATASRAELQRLHDLFGHDPVRKVIVKTLLQRPGDPVGDLRPAHAVGFPTLLTNHRPFAKAPAAAKAWIDEWRRFQPRWV